MSSKTAKLFVNGGSQAVRLPAEFRFDDAQQVFVRRDSITGDLILSATSTNDSWAAFFAVRDKAAVPDDFLDKRPLNEPLRTPDSSEDR